MTQGRILAVVLMLLPGLFTGIVVVVLREPGLALIIILCLLIGGDNFYRSLWTEKS